MTESIVEQLFHLTCLEQTLTDDFRLAQDEYHERLRVNQMQRQSIVDQLRAPSLAADKTTAKRRHNPMVDCPFNEILPHHQHRHGTVSCSKASPTDVCTLFELRQNISPTGWKRARMEEILMKK
jgi:hypothetical protein